MSTWDDLVTRALELKQNAGASTFDAAMAVAEANPAEIRMAAIDTISKRIRKALNANWKWSGGHYDQLTMFVEDERFQVPDRPVRFKDEAGSVDYKPRRFATSREAIESKETLIREHQKEIRLVEREHHIETQTEAQMQLLGLNTEKQWDALRHQDTICQRCGRGYDPDDPFEVGHKIANVLGGGEGIVGWEHMSCNRSAKANPVDA